VYSSVKLQFDLDDLEQDERLKFRGIREATNADVGSSYNGYSNPREINSSWIRNQNEAVIIAQHYLDNHATAYAHVEFTTSNYGLESELYRVLDVTHRSGSMTNMLFRIEDINMSLNEDRVSLGIKQIKDQSGYGLWTPVNAGSTTTHSVTGTSTCGWGWLYPYSSGSHGTVHAVTSQTQIEFRDNDGLAPSFGSVTFSAFVCFGSAEIAKCTDITPQVVKTFERGAETTKQGSDVQVGDPWMLWPMGSNFEIIPLFKWGTLPLASDKAYGTAYGTVHSISTGSYGTVWRWF
jgi:hypothetical protein